MLTLLAPTGANETPATPGGSAAVVQVQLLAHAPASLDQNRDTLVAALGERFQFSRPGQSERRSERLLYDELHINSRSAHVGEGTSLSPMTGRR